MDEIDLMEVLVMARRRRMAGRLRPYGITLPQFNLIRLARRGGATSPSAAAAELDWDRPTLTIVARACVREGWLARSRFIADRRSARLELTGRGEELLDRIEADKPFGPQNFGDPFDVVSANERALLARMLDRLSRRARDIWRVSDGRS